jgi:hypothetical protein
MSHIRARPGQVFGFLTVVKDSGIRHGESKRLVWLCRCECGNEALVQSVLLNTGRTKSCGCFQRQYRLTGKIRHGDSSKRSMGREYISWLAMKSRCANPRNNRFQYYGARGIKVCDRWQSYEEFLEDMGRKPSPSHSIDRIDVNGDYEPDNCRWATPVEQRRNRRDFVITV